MREKNIERVMCGLETNGQQKVYTFLCHETKIKLA